MPKRLLNRSVVKVAAKSGLGLSAVAACKQPHARLVVVGRNADSTEFVRRQLGGSARFLHSVMTRK